MLPRPEKVRTLLVSGGDDAGGIETMTLALQGPFEVSGVAHLPAAAAKRSSVSYVSGAGRAVTAIRVEGPAPSVAARLAGLRDVLAARGEAEELHTDHSKTLWAEIRDVAVFVAGGDDQVWRLPVPPSQGADAAREIRDGLGAEIYFDWGGGLIWVAVAPREDGGAGVIRAAAAAAGGQAALIRAPAELRRRIPVFPPRDGGVGALSRRIKDNFDPQGILNPGRMYDGARDGAP